MSQVLPAVPAATDGDGGVTYSIEESLPAGLSFAAATRTISGTPTAVQAAANYTLAATDADGDKATLRFSIEIQGIMVAIDSPSVTEGDSGSKNLTFTATLSRASAQQVTVDYADAGTGTAASGTDYTAITDGTLTFTAGTTSQTFDVSVTGDTTDEPDETILVTLSDASGATISTATGTGTITDDDDPPTVSGRRGERDGGGQRLEEPDVHGGVERRERQAGDGELGGGDGRHRHFRDGLHGHHGREADLRGGDDQPDLQRVGDGRRRGRVERDGGGDVEQPDERDDLGHGGQRHGDHHR